MAKSNQPVEGEDTERIAANNEQETSGVSRRAALAGLGLVGLLGTTSTASAASGDHLGEEWEGQSGRNFGLRVDKRDSGYALHGISGNDTNDTTDIGVQGETYSNQGIALNGHAKANNGLTRGLQGRTDSPDGWGVSARATSSTSGNSKAINAVNFATAGVGIDSRVSGSGETIAVQGRVDSSSGFGLYTPDAAKVDGKLEVGGDLAVTGTKDFVQAVDTTAGPKNIHYTAIEAGESMTEHTGVAEMEDGHALIELPEHFDMVTSDAEPIAVQVTPHAEEKVHPQVVEKSARYISVEDFGDGPDEYGFSYTVKGVRDGFEDKEIVRDP